MFIPEKLKVMGHEYEVLSKPDLYIEEGTSGQCCPGNLKIHLATGTKESKLAETFLHEIFEALKYHLQTELNHDDLSALSEGLFCVIRDNNLNFNKEPTD